MLRNIRAVRMLAVLLAAALLAAVPAIAQAPAPTPLKIGNLFVNGKRIYYAISLDAVVTFTLEQRGKGRMAGTTCVAETAKNRKLKPCVLYTPIAGSFTHNGTAGPDDLLLPVTVGTTKLISGSYRLTATPSAGGQTAKPAKREFSVRIKGT